MRSIIPHVLVIAFAACDTPAPQDAPEQDTRPGTGKNISPDDLLGEWLDVQDSGRTHVHERWQRTADGTLTGLGCVLSGNDTVFIENLALLRLNDTLHYAVSIGKGGGEAVLFKLVHDRDSLVFVNPEHDMPQRIVYTPEGSNAWHAKVSGTHQGRTAVDHYHFERVVQEETKH